MQFKRERFFSKKPSTGVPTASLKLARDNESISIGDPARFSISGQALEKIKGKAVEDQAQART